MFGNLKPNLSCKTVCSKKGDITSTAPYYNEYNIDELISINMVQTISFPKIQHLLLKNLDTIFDPGLENQLDSDEYFKPSKNCVIF